MHSLKDCKKTKKRVGHCLNAVQNQENGNGQRVYKSKIFNSTTKNCKGSTNWKLDWARCNNKSYAWVLKQSKYQFNNNDKSVKHMGTVKKRSKCITNSTVANTGNRVNGAQDLGVDYKLINVKKCFHKVGKVNAVPLRNSFAILNNMDNTKT